MSFPYGQAVEDEQETKWDWGKDENEMMKLYCVLRMLQRRVLNVLKHIDKIMAH
jgi:hypothetical protein